MEVLGESSSPGTNHRPFPHLLPEAPQEAPASLEVSASHLTEAETEAQVGEVTWSRSHDKLEMEVAQELKLANCQLIFFGEKKFSSGTLVQRSRSRWAMSFVSSATQWV